MLGFVVGASAALAQIHYRVPPYTQTAPPLGGSYRPLGNVAHPFVFTTPAQAERLLADTSPSAKKALSYLEDQTRADIDRSAALTGPPYSGCDIDRYTFEFAYGGNGATTIAPRLAMYSYLTSLHQGYGDPALAEKATALAKTIMLNWANNGWKNKGRFRNTPADYCAGKGQTLPQAIVWHLIALQAGRGMPNWIQAQDLLYALKAFSPEEKAQLNVFLSNMFSLLVLTANNKTVTEVRDCDRFNNQTSATLAGMAAIARFRNDAAAIKSIADGTGGQIVLPWTQQVQGNIYGVGDKMRGCFDLSTAVRFSNYFQIATVAPGEVEDRFRGHKGQPFGYALGSVAYLMLTAQILQDSGYHAFRYTGENGQSVEMALDYYSYYFTKWLSLEDTFVPPGPDPYPSYEQYVGQPVSKGTGTVTGVEGILNPYMLALRAYPNDPKIRGVLDKAESFSDKVVPLYGFDTIAMQNLPLLDNLISTSAPAMKKR
jgi:hypothetical protein